MLRPLSTFALALSLATTSTLVAAASEPSPSEISVARRLFEEGKAAEDARRFREAAEKFRKAVAIKDTPGIRFHLARCEEEQGALVEALVEYDRARELLESGVKAPDVERLLPEARQRVQSQLAFVTLRLPEGVSDATVELDGRPLASSTWDGPIPVNPGKHRLSATAPGRASFTAELSLNVGESKPLVIQLPLEGAAVTPETPTASVTAPAPRRKPAEADGETARTVTLVGEAALFAAGLTTGIVFIVAKGGAAERYDTASEQVLAQVGGSDPNGIACSVPREGCADLDRARREEERNGKLATVSFVTAGVSALAFGLTLALWKTEPPARVSAGIGPNRASLLISTEF